MQVIATAAQLYEGKTADPDRKAQLHYFEETLKTHLQGTSGVRPQWRSTSKEMTRAITHQMVRQRIAVYVQESLRFAVKSEDELFDNVAYQPGTAIEIPTSLKALPEEDHARQVYMRAIRQMANAYTTLVEHGIPAEDARHLLPHATKTRIIYGTSLRHFLDTLGNRLCTQAQFQWRELASKMLEALDTQTPTEDQDDWAAITQRAKPTCFATGHCPFQAGFDRNCTIRERMDTGRQHEVEDAEWMLDPNAAR